MTEREAYLYVKLHQFRYLEDKTMLFIHHALSQVERPYVACSFGKDSSVMLHMILRARFFHPLPVKFLGKLETNLIDDYTKVIAWWEQQYPPLSVERITYTGWLEDPTAKTGIAANVTDADHDAFFVGLRIDESVGRRISLKKHGKLYRMKSGKTRIAPLADWTTRDVAAYMLHHGLPVLKAYQREGFEARTTSNIPSKYPHEALARLKDQDIAAYNQLLRLLPDAVYFT